MFVDRGPSRDARCVASWLSPGQSTEIDFRDPKSEGGLQIVRLPGVVHGDPGVGGPPGGLGTASRTPGRPAPGLPRGLPGLPGRAPSVPEALPGAPRALPTTGIALPATPIARSTTGTALPATGSRRRPRTPRPMSAAAWDS